MKQIPVESFLSFVIKSYVVAVPKSITIHGPPYNSYAPTASTILSVPTSLGFAR